MKHRNTQKKLLVESGLTLEKVIKVAIADEATNQEVTQLAKATGLSPTNEIHYMKATSSKWSKSKTNKENHSAEKCRFKHATCHKCNIQGHIAPVCKPSKKSQVHAVKEKLSDS